MRSRLSLAMFQSTGRIVADTAIIARVTTIQIAILREFFGDEKTLFTERTGNYFESC